MSIQGCIDASLSEWEKWMNPKFENAKDKTYGRTVGEMDTMIDTHTVRKCKCACCMHINCSNKHISNDCNVHSGFINTKDSSSPSALDHITFSTNSIGK